MTEYKSKKLKSVLTQYSDVFIEPDGSLGRTQNTVSIRGMQDLLNCLQDASQSTRKKIAEQEIDKVLREDVIEPSNSSWAAPIELVKKQDGTTSFCVDYRKLNSVTKKDANPLPRIDESIDTLSGAKYYVLLTLRAGTGMLSWMRLTSKRQRLQPTKGSFNLKSYHSAFPTTQPHLNVLWKPYFLDYSGSDV